MKLYRAQIPKISHEIIQTLADGGEIELVTGGQLEAEKDIAAVMEEYVRMDMKILNDAKDMAASRLESQENLSRIRKELAERYNHPSGESGIRWMTSQIAEALMRSPHLEEVFADDDLLHKKIREIFRKSLVSDDKIDAEVRARLKNVQEGTPAWEIQYQKTLKEIRRKHGLV